MSFGRMVVVLVSGRMMLGSSATKAHLGTPRHIGRFYDSKEREADVMIGGGI